MKKILSFFLIWGMLVTYIPLTFAETQDIANESSSEPAAEESAAPPPLPEEDNFSVSDEGGESEEIVDTEEETAAEESPELETPETAPMETSSSSDGSAGYTYFDEDFFYKPSDTAKLFDRGEHHIEEFTGELGYSYVIDTPKPRGDFSVNVSLRYSNKNTKEETKLGHGWEILENVIRRDMKQGTDSNNDEIFFVSIFGQTVEIKKVSETDGEKIYYPRYGSENMKVVYQNEQFIVYDSTGIKYIFDYKQIEYAWYLTSAEDPNGNKITLQYIFDTNQVYPQRILYNYVNNEARTKIEYVYKERNIPIYDGTKGFLITTRKILDRVEIYSEGIKRSESEFVYNPGANGNRKLLSEIIEKRYNKEGQGKVLPKTEFSYSKNEEEGWGEEEETTYPAANVFKCRYDPRGSKYDPDRFTSKDLGVMNVDINGDGLIDVLKHTRAYPSDWSSSYLNTGKESWIKSSGFRSLSGLSISGYGGNCPKVEESGVRIGDFNGDMKLDIIDGKVNESNGDWACRGKVYINNGLSSTFTLPACPYKDVGYRKPKLDRGMNIIDINGDGLADIVQAFTGNHYYPWDCDEYDCKGRTVRIFINNGRNWEQSSEWESRFPENVIFSRYFISGGEYVVQSGKATFQDLNNDGLPDIVSEPRAVYLNTGNGWVYNGLYSLPRGMELRKNDHPGIRSSMMDSGLRFSDLNGDGLPDITKYVNYRHRDLGNYDFDIDEYSGVYKTDVKTYLNTGNGWKLAPQWDLPEETINYVYPSYQESDIQSLYDHGERFIDMNNDEMNDYVVSYVHEENVRWDPTHSWGSVIHMRYFKRQYINKAKKPDILTKIHTPRGGSVLINYQASTQYANNKKLPIKISTVKQIQVEDGMGNKKITEYNYSDGYYNYKNPREKEFVGFGKVEKKNSEGRTVVSYYHQGGGRNGVNEGEYQDHISKKGRKYREEIYDKTGKKLTQSIYTWDSETKEKDRYFVYNKKTVTSDFNQSNEHRDKAEEYFYNFQTGNLVESKQYGEVEADAKTGEFRDIGDDMVITRYKYAENQSRNIFSYKKEVSVYDQSENFLTKERLYYDQLLYGGIQKGNMTRKEIELKEENRFIGVEYRYDRYGNPVEQIDAKKNKISIEYEETGLYPRQIQNAKGQKIKVGYDIFWGNIEEIEAPNGTIILYRYYPEGRIKEEETESMDGEERGRKIIKKLKYNDKIFPQKKEIEIYNVAHPSGYQKIISYTDGLGREIQTRTETAEEYTVIDKVYNNRGLLEIQSLASRQNEELYIPWNKIGPRTRYEYDALIRQTKIINDLGETKISYQPWVSEIIDPEGRKKQTEIDAFGRTSKVREYLDGRTLETEYIYDHLGRMIKIKDALGNERGFHYDSLGRLVSSSEWYRASPDKWWRYEYDDNGNLVKTVDPKEQMITAEHDELNRLIFKNIPCSKEIKEFHGEEECRNNTIHENYTYDNKENGVGKVGDVRITTKNQEVLSEYHYEYDRLGRVREYVQEISGESFVSKTKTDEIGRVIEMVYPDQSIVSYKYEKGGNLKKVEYENKEKINEIISSVTYSPLGQVEEMVYGNGTQVVNTYSVNQMYRLVEKKTEKGGTVLQSFGYSYDKTGNILTIADTVKGETTQYEYDDINRLIRSTVSSSTELEEYIRTYSYDDIGNILDKSDIGAYEYTDPNPQILSKAGDRSYTYDLNGNRITETRPEGGTEYEWDSNNQLIQTTADGEESFYRYDHTGQRILKENKGQRIFYHNKFYEKEIKEATNTRENSETIRKYVFVGNQRISTISRKKTTPNTLPEEKIPDITQGLLMRLKLNEGTGTTVTDSSVNNQTGSVKTANWVEGINGTALNFTGNEYINLSSSSVLRQNNAITYSFWTKLPAGGGGVVMGVGAAGGQGYGGIFMNENTLGYTWTPSGIGSDRAVTAGIELNPEEWAHIAVSINYDNRKIKMYVNGEARDVNIPGLSGVWSPKTNYNNGLIDSMGGRYINGMRYFKGSIDEVSIYNRSLNSSEVQVLYEQQGQNGNDNGDLNSGLKLRLKLDEGTGSSTADTSGYNQTGNISNGTWIEGKYNKALSFTGNGYINLGQNTNLRQSKTITYAMWVKIPSGGGGHLIGAGAAGGQGYGGVLLSENQIRYYWTPRGISSDRSATAEVSIPSDTWTHVIVSANYNQRQIKMYINGEKLTVNVPGINNTWEPLNTYNNGFIDSVGGRYINSMQYFTGQIDEVNVYDRMLTEPEIEALYKIPGAYGEEGLEIYYKIKGGYGDLVLDYSGTNRHGILSGKTTIATDNEQAYLDLIDNGYINLGTNSVLRQSKELTYSFWTKLPAGGGGVVMGVGAAGGQGYGGIFMNENTLGYTWTPSGIGSDRAVTAGIELNQEEWAHIAVSINYDNREIKMYVNGEARDVNIPGLSGVWSPKTNYNNGLIDSIGGRYINGMRYFKGNLDEIKIYSRALDSDIITKIYQRGRISGILGETTGSCQNQESDQTTIETMYHHADHLGSASVTTNENGEIISDIRYYPYGDTRYEDANYEVKYKYNDKELDTETDLYYYGARYYDSAVGRWVSNDPLQRDVPKMVKLNELNGYRYVMGNPMKYTDPTGEYTWSEWKFFSANPEKINTVYNIKTYVEEVVAEKFDSGFLNGKADAFRHTLWNAIMTKELGADISKKVGDAHEDFEGNPEDEKQMDLYNNQTGRKIGEKYSDSKHNWEDIVDGVENALKNGELQTGLKNNGDKIENEQYYDQGYYHEKYTQECSEKENNYYEKSKNDYDKTYKEDYRKKKKN